MIKKQRDALLESPHYIKRAIEKMRVADSSWNRGVLTSKMISTKYSFPSDTRFGWFLTFVLGVVAIYFHFKLADEGYASGLGAAAIITMLITLFKPKLLSPFNRAWMLLGNLLGRVVSPLVLGVIFFLIITPTALIGRALGRDELRLRRKAQSSYWIDRKSPSPRGDSFNNQF